MTTPRDRRLTNYDRVVSEGRARVRASRERCRTWELERLEREQLSPAVREKRERELRTKWWLEDFNADLDEHVRREALLRQFDEIDEVTSRTRRLEEALTISSTEGSMQMYRGPLLGKGRTPLDLARRFHRIRTERPGDPEIPDLRAQVDQWARELDIEIRWTAKPVNGYAWRRTKEIEIAPIRSEAAFATAAHEIGHVACPCESDHVRVPRKTWLGTVCVACELAAWHWAMARSPRWTWEMHADMADALPSYRDYGSAEHQAEIDRLTSRLGFHEIRLQRVTQKG